MRSAALRHPPNSRARAAGATPQGSKPLSPLLCARPCRRARACARRDATTDKASGALVDVRRRSEGPYASFYAEIELDTTPGAGAAISLHELTPLVKRAVAESGVADGSVLVTAAHTTTAVVVNEHEPRLMDDVRQFLRRLAPASDPWLHNDLHLRFAPDGWPGGDEAWRAQEPVNAQAHVQALLLGGSATLAVVGGALKIGRWQSVIGVELDGPRRRRWGVAVQGLVAPEEAR